MKRLRIFIIIFFIFLSIPLGYFILRTYQSLDQEEMVELRYFADTLFFEMEQELADFIEKEEGRDIDEYTDFSDISAVPKKSYILGYFQNNPDGSFQTPMALKERDLKEAGEKDKGAFARADEVVRELEADNRIFNTKRTEASHRTEVNQPEKIITESESKFAGKYLDLSRSKKQKAFLGQEKKRVEEIPARQVLNLAKQEQKTAKAERWKSPAPAAESISRRGQRDESWDQPRDQIDESAGSPRADIYDEQRISDTKSSDSLSSIAEDHELADVFSRKVPVDKIPSQPYQKDFDDATFRVEVDPMQSVFISDNKVVLFRRIVIDNRVYRQGVVIFAKEFLSHLAESYFEKQPMAKFTRLYLSIFDQGKDKTIIQAGAGAQNPKFSLSRTFPRPFSFLTAKSALDEMASSDARNTLTIMMTIMGMVILIGFFAIYQSARSIVAMSERRSGFVASVTHELKTPLTNIRMYVEMLEQGIATTPEREQDYFKILGSESTRLSRLINNVLEFSKLEKKNRQLDLFAGTFEDIIEEVTGIMREKLKQEGFSFTVAKKDVSPFMYDRDVMVQVLINLIENSIKFGKKESEKTISLFLEPEGSEMKVSLADTGPGIPRKALKKVFDDFYRVDNELTRSTGGTGIGLALVSKFIKAMGGRVMAKNNTGPGCTITFFLPLYKQVS